MTFSIVAWDADARPSPEWGVAVASKFLAVGSVVAWAKAGAGALATQALANLSYGPDGIERLASGHSADDVVRALTEPDPEREQRQLGVVDAKGRAASFTGQECFDWAGHRIGEGYCCQGNILAASKVVERMGAAFEDSAGSLAERLLASLRAGDAAGGDRRGRQSASILVVREGGGYGGGIDRAVDLRVDDHARPIDELARLIELHSLYFPRPDELEFIDVDEALANRVRALLSGLGYRPGNVRGPYDEELRRALFAFVGTENLEERWSDDPKIESRVLEHLRDRARQAAGPSSSGTRA